MISYRHADFQEYVKKRDEEKLKSSDLSSLSKNPGISNTINETLRWAYEKIGSEYELYDAVSEERVYPYGGPEEGYEGFVMDGFTSIDHMIGSGARPSNKEFSDVVDKIENDSYNNAQKLLRENYPEQTEGISDDKLNYHDLYDMDKGDLAEILSEIETEEQGHTVTFKIEVEYVPPHEYWAQGKNAEPPAVVMNFVMEIEGISFGVNMREKISFTRLSELESKMKILIGEYLKKIY